MSIPPSVIDDGGERRLQPGGIESGALPRQRRPLELEEAEDRGASSPSSGGSVRPCSSMSEGDIEPATLDAARSTVARMTCPSSSGRVNCGQWPVGRSTYSTSVILVNSRTGAAPCSIQSAEHLARELGRDDGDGNVVAAFVGELLRVAGDVLGRRDRPLAERGERLVVEIDELLVLELRPLRQRDLAVLRGEPVGDGVTVARREATDVHDAGDPVRPGVDGGVGDRGAGGVADEHDLSPVDGVDRRDDRVDVVAQGDLRSGRRPSTPCRAT